MPEPYVPPPRVVPDFPAIRVGRRGVRRLLPAPRRGRGPLVLGIAVAAAVLAVSAGYRPPPARTAAVRPVRAPAAARPVHDPASEVVRAPVRIADAAAVRLLRPGDRVDVLAASRVVASAVAVVAIPGQPGGGPPAGTAASGSAEGDLPPGAAEAGVGGGALVVLAVPRRVAAALSGAAASSALAVTLC